MSSMADGGERIVRGFAGVKRQALIVGIALLAVSGIAQAQSQTATENIQINGSFEYATNPSIPDYWAGTGRFYRSNGLPAEFRSEDGRALFRKSFHLDTSTAHHGERSIRIARPCFLLSMPAKVAPKTDYTVSLWLQGEFASRQVRLAVTPRDTHNPVLEKVVTVDTEWTRHDLLLEDYAHSQISLQVIPLDSGKIWVDSVQIEAGREASAFRPSPYDAGFKLPQPVVHPEPGALEPPRLILGEPVASPPTIDAKLDESVWANTQPVTMSDYMGTPTSVLTEVRMAYDKQALYLHITCADPGQAGGIGDSLEILIDVMGIGDPYYQFILDAQGNQRNFRSLRGIHQWDWQADWKAATQMGDGAWTAEIAIPFAAMPDTLTMANLSSLRVNVCRNYAPGPEKYLSWAPVRVGFLEPEGFGHVILGASDTTLALDNLTLIETNAPESRFMATVTASNRTPQAKRIHLTVSVEESGQAVQAKSIAVDLPPTVSQQVTVPGFTLTSKRSRITLLASNTDGQVLTQKRQFLDVPHAMELYTEYSYYTDEPTARIVAEFGDTFDLPDDAILELTLRVAGYPTKLTTKSFSPAAHGDQQIFELPIANRQPGQIFEVDGRLLAADWTLLAKADAKLFKHRPHPTEVKINRINRGLYLNGEPYIPYGIQVPSMDLQQLRDYRKVGFDFINFISHWNSPEQGIEFLTDCEQAGVNAIAFHVARPHRISPPEAVERYRDQKSLIGFVPNDEESDPQVYDIAIRNQVGNPYLLTAINHNFTSYRAFHNRLDGLPGDVLSIDRYPLLALPKGRPHTTSEIYSVERCIEMMDQDGQRERMPSVFWLQGGERFAKEPTPQEITWLNYILLVNHCVGFTYFGGMPASESLWQRMISLNQEIQQLKPYLFSLEAEPHIQFANDESRHFISVLPKVVGDELLLICVNRAMTPIDAAIDLSGLERFAPGSAAVLFERRAVPVKADGIVQDRFEPLARHVYKLRLQ